MDLKEKQKIGHRRCRSYGEPRTTWSHHINVKKSLSLGEEKKREGQKEMMIYGKKELLNPQLKSSGVISSCASPLFEFRNSIVEIVSRPRWLFMNVFSLMDAYAAVVLTVFGPKYIETVFATEASAASVYIGGIICPAAALGVLFAGAVTKKFKLGYRGQTFLVLGLASLSCLAISFLTAIRCPRQSTK